MAKEALSTDVLSLTDTEAANLITYQRLLLQWNQRINLIGKSTQDDIVERHIKDSLGLRVSLPKHPCHIADFGSGAGFPGLVIAMSTKHTVHLIETVSKKCCFLREVLRITHTSGNVVNNRIENLPPQKFDVITARALAELSQLWAWSYPCLQPSGYAVLLKANTSKTTQEISNLQTRFPNTLVKCQDHPFTSSKIVIIANRQNYT